MASPLRGGSHAVRPTAGDRHAADRRARPAPDGVVRGRPHDARRPGPHRRPAAPHQAGRAATRDRLRSNGRCTSEQQQFDVLRAQRAELRSPTRLAVAAGALGMSPGLESQFIAVDPMVLAITIARTGEVPAADDDRRRPTPACARSTSSESSSH